MKRSQPTRDWRQAQEKLEEEPWCRACGKTFCLEKAHILGRIYDQPKEPGSKTLYVDPDSIVPLCGPFPEGCHGKYDRHELNILSVLTTPEQVKAVEDAGSIEAARIRLAPLDFKQVAFLEARIVELESKVAA